jgi:hypothetical protein
MTRVGQSLARPTSVLAHAGAETITRPLWCCARPGTFAMYGLTFIQTCAVCRRPWFSDDERWRAYHVGDDPAEPAELVFFCPDCAEREFSGD